MANNLSCRAWSIANAILVDPRNKRFGSAHIIAIVLAQRVEKRIFLDPDSPEKRAGDWHGEKQDRPPVSQAETESQKSDKRSDVGWMPDVTVRAGIDELLIRIK